MRYYLKPNAIIFLLLCINIAFGQKLNYLNIRESLLTTTCGKKDSGDVENTIKNLERLDTNLIGKNMNIYYEDLAIYYWLASGLKNQEYLLKSVNANLRALYHKPKSTKALWDLAFAYVYLNDCKNGKYYMSLYRKYSLKKYWNRDLAVQVEKLMARCN